MGRDRVRELPATPLLFKRPRRILLVALVSLGAVLGHAEARGGQLNLAWVDTSGGQAGFQIERKTGTNGTYGQIAVAPPGITTYGDSSVVAGTTYCYRVRAYSGTGVSAYSNEACGSISASFDLTVSVTGASGGVVTSNPAGINCGPDCFESYPSATLVTLTGTAATGWTFSGWNGGGCSGTSPCSLVGNAPVTVGAAFTQVAPTLYTLTVTKAGPGTVTSSPTGISCGSDCSEAYTSGTMVTLTATPNNGASFTGWSGGCAGTGACAVTLTANVSVSATFVRGKKK